MFHFGTLSVIEIGGSNGSCRLTLVIRPEHFPGIQSKHDNLLFDRSKIT